MLDGLRTYIADKGSDLKLYVDGVRNGSNGYAATASTDDYNAMLGTVTMIVGGIEHDIIVIGIGFIMGVAGLYHARKLSNRIGPFDSGFGKLF